MENCIKEQQPARFADRTSAQTPPTLVKIGVRVSVRAVRLAFDNGFPKAGLFRQVLAPLQRLLCAASGSLFEHRLEARRRSSELLRPMGGWAGQSCGNDPGPGGPDRALARIPRPHFASLRGSATRSGSNALESRTRQKVALSGLRVI